MWFEGIDIFIERSKEIIGEKKRREGKSREEWKWEKEKWIKDLREIFEISILRPLNVCFMYKGSTHSWKKKQ